MMDTMSARDDVNQTNNNTWEFINIFIVLLYRGGVILWIGFNRIISISKLSNRRFPLFCDTEVVDEGNAEHNAR